MDGNPYTEDEDQASEYLRLAVGLLSKHHVPLSPLNYRLGYDTVSGRGAELEKVFQEGTSPSQTSTAERLWELHQRSYTVDCDSLESIRQELTSIVNSMQCEIKGSGDALSKYVARLNHFASILSKPFSAQAMTQEVESVKEHTLATESTHLQMSAQLSRISGEMESLRKELAQVRAETYKDFLTGISNRKAFDAALKDAICCARSDKSTFSILIADIDHFKSVNDAYGHLVGDKVLRFVAATFKRFINGKGTVARIGGEEFGAILPNTDITGAYSVGEQIRRTVSNGKIKDMGNQHVLAQITISAGVTQFDSRDVKNQLLHRADQALYRAKDKGRNRLEVARLGYSV